MEGGAGWTGSRVKQRACVPLCVVPLTQAQGSSTHRDVRALAHWQVFPLVDPSKGYTHISPGVCDKCITDASGERCPVANPILAFLTPGPGWLWLGGEHACESIRVPC